MLTNEQRERNERRQQAIIDSYHVDDQLRRGLVTPAEAEAAKRKLVGIIATDTFSDGAIYERLAEGDSVVLAGPTDSDLENLAAQVGGYSEVHALLRQPLTRENLMDAAQGFEGMSSLAATRMQDAALRKVQHQRDNESVRAGQISVPEFEERDEQRLQEVRRARGESLSSGDLQDATQYIEMRKAEDAEREEAARRARHSHGDVRAPGPGYTYWPRASG
jgi:hypothetical protein